MHSFRGNVRLLMLNGHLLFHGNDVFDGCLVRDRNGPLL